MAEKGLFKSTYRLKIGLAGSKGYGTPGKVQNVLNDLIFIPSNYQ